MNFFKVQIISILLFIINLAFGQKIETYEGPFQNGLPQQATARFTYYLDAKANKIKQGNFRYLVKLKDRDFRFLQNFQGEYSNGLKNGSWEYETKSKDYGIDKQGFSTSIDMSMKANYINGIPEGSWEFRAFITKRKKIPTQGEIQWTKSDTLKDVVIKLNFAKGLLVDSIQIHDNMHVNIDLWCDKNGFIVGNFAVNMFKDSLISFYEDGFLSMTKNNNIEAKNVDFQFYKSNMNAKNKDFVLDTNSLFDQKDCSIRNYLDDNIFNNGYFMFKYIDGDAFMKTNNRGQIQSINYKGLKYKSLIVKLTLEEKKIISDIKYYYSNVNNLYSKAEADFKKSNSDKVLRSRRDELLKLYNEIKSYNCVAEQAKIEAVTSELLAKSISKCGNLPLLNLKISTKKDLLLKLLDASKKANLQAEKMSGK